MIQASDRLAHDVAQALLDIEAVVFTPHAPITFKSGIRSPVYVDNRRLIFWPAQWRIIIEGFRATIAAQNLAFDVIAGVAAAGIPHSSALAYLLETPSVFVRKEAKEHGTRSRVEGGPVTGRRILLVEDLVTTGSSSLAGVEALRSEGAVVADCLCITGYGLPEAERAFREAGVTLHQLTPFQAIAGEAARRGLFDAEAHDLVNAWLRDPHHWTENEPL